MIWLCETSELTRRPILFFLHTKKKLWQNGTGRNIKLLYAMNEEVDTILKKNFKYFSQPVSYLNEGVKTCLVFF